MTAIAAYSIVRANALERGTSSVHAVEKISPRSEFDGEYASRHQPQSWICTSSGKRSTSRSGTSEVDPYWDGPRLTPTFVAQVMGQVYGTNTTSPSAAAAYRRTVPVCPAVFDRNV
jgi:hypothetical protein